MRSPFRKRKFDSAATLGIVPGHGGLGLYAARGLGASSSPSAVAQAIATAEGYGPAGNIPTIANNPGDLELGNIGYGVTAAAGGQQITNFPSAAAGWTALENQINSIASGTSSAGYSPTMSIAQVGQLYSGGSSSWANNVAAALGVTPDASFAAQVANPGTPADTSASGDDVVSILSSTSDNTYLYAGVGLAGLVLLAWVVS